MSTADRLGSVIEPLLTGLVSKRPEVRVDWAYTELKEGIESGQWDDHLDQIRDRLNGYLRTEKVWTKALSARLLNVLAAAGHFHYEDYLAFRAWYVTEEDTRGIVKDIGPILAVGYGADYVETCVRKGMIPPVEAAAIISCRLRAPGGVWHDDEGVRLARAACATIGESTSPHILEIWIERLSDTVLAEGVRNGNREVVENFAQFLKTTGDLIRSEPEKWGIDDERAQLALPLIAELEEQLGTASNYREAAP
ncbi:hypothetical protein [Corynebacterium sp. HMSC078H07]|uniref:hypothetical protein n=1 Tax=Corynebacterium sp. HMSC078H07 TaxID=1739379 RepID=UPI0008A16B9A|nr:hypothetical protein [Corynebacterium sp. HMSC078H07]OFR68363.1 hypothetical protein HMPREF2875_05950 [Corynebacterium sp. HMSC078H07]